MSTVLNEFGDFRISGSAATLNGTTGVPIYEFEPEKDGVYSTQAMVLAWQPGGTAVQVYLEAVWKSVGGVVSVDGTLLTSEVGTLAPAGITSDVSAGKARLLVTGIPNRQILWRMKGVRFDVTA